MALELLNSIKPDSYHPNIHSINYLKLHQNGVRYALFDLDHTIVPMNSNKISEDDISLFNYINLSGITVGLCSDNSKKRISSIANRLNVNYLARAKKPLGVTFNDIQTLFGVYSDPSNTIYIGDSLLLDMYLAKRLKVYKIMVDMVKEEHNPITIVNDKIQCAMFQALKPTGLKKGQYYIGSKER